MQEMDGKLLRGEVRKRERERDRQTNRQIDRDRQTDSKLTDNDRNRHGMKNRHVNI